MPDAPTYPKRLIEVDLPIRRISAHARREKSIRHGHISTLHIWWARRPLAACRAVLCAALWPDPADPLCPEGFREVATREMRAWATMHMKVLSPESYPRFNAIAREPKMLDNLVELRNALLDFIADFANWDNSTVKEYLDTSRALTKAAHEALGGESGTRPLVVDSFAGGGAIPLEALRVGAESFASDLNPLPVILNKVVLEYIPKYGERLVDELRKWGSWIGEEAGKELAPYFPKDAGKVAPIAYLWARTVNCEGPGCGVEIPLIRSLWLSRKTPRSVALQIRPCGHSEGLEFQIIIKDRGGWVDQASSARVVDPKFDGTVKRGSATCPCCGYTTPVARVREQMKRREGGAADARLLCVVTTRTDESGRSYRLPCQKDREAVEAARTALKQMQQAYKGPLALVPDEVLDVRGIRHTWAMIYGISRWGDCFTPRQQLAMVTYVKVLARAAEKIRLSHEPDFCDALQTVLALAIGRLADYNSSLCRWVPAGEFIGNTFGRQAIPMIWDFCEVNPASESTGGYSGACSWIEAVLRRETRAVLPSGQALSATATDHPLPSDAADAFVTDPPYYDSVPYAFLSDFFYVWLRRNLASVYPELLSGSHVPKDQEIVVDRQHELSNSVHDVEFYERELTKASGEGRRVLKPEGIGVVVFASKTTSSWEAILQAIVDSGWTITGSWPIDTEMGSRIAAAGQARLASSIHLVCRPRENPDGSIREDQVGDWREVLRELPRRIHEWMPKLAEEGVVGADAIFACLGPALEIYSRFSRVEKTSGEVVKLKEFLEHVWAAVSKEALSMIFRDAETSGLEPDARLTAMWLWTLAAPTGSDAAEAAEAVTDEDSGEAEDAAPKAKTVGFVLEFDAARKIAQGLGARLDELTTVVEVKSDKARLLSVGERAKALFAKAEKAAAVVRKKAAKQKQMMLFEEDIEQAAEEQGWDAVGAPEAGKTTLDRVHQAMLLFGTGRGEALKRFLVEEGVGRQAPFWKLAQALSALYPAGCDEKRWVDGVLARKKGLGF